MKYDAAIEGAEFGGMKSPKPGEAFCVATAAVVETESSLWTLVANENAPGGRYSRAPKDGQRRVEAQSIEGRLDDGHWYAYEWATWSDQGLTPNGVRLNIKPVAGPVDGAGILTGAVLGVKPY